MAVSNLGYSRWIPGKAHFASIRETYLSTPGLVLRIDSVSKRVCADWESRTAIPTPSYSRYYFPPFDIQGMRTASPALLETWEEPEDLADSVSNSAVDADDQAIRGPGRSSLQGRWSVKATPMARPSMLRHERWAR